MFSVEVNQIGDLDGIIGALDPAKIAASLLLVRKKVLRRLAEEYLERLSAAMRAGQAQGPSLSESWTEQKGHGTPWIHTLDLVNALTIVELPDGVIHIGVPDEASNRDGKQLSLIASILELGSLTVPARPVFDPVLRELVADSKVMDEVGRIAKAVVRF